MSVPKCLALLVAGLTIALTIRLGTFTPWGTDAAGYIEAGRRWHTGELMTPSPLHFWPPLAEHGLTVSPLAFRPGAIRGTEVSLYPLGYPVLIAAATLLAGDLAAYAVAPLGAGLLVWCVYLLAARAAGAWGGLAGAILMAISPVTLMYAVTPMSDVPGAALWALAWVMSLRAGLGASAGAAAAASLAMMIRPQLAPLGLVPLLLLLLDGRLQNPRHGRWAWKRGALFVLIAPLAPALVAWSQAILYGDPWRPGYIGWDSFFRLAHIPTNLALFPRQMMVVHSPVIFLGLGAPLLFVTRSLRGAFDDRAQLVVISAFIVIALNYAVYLPYMPHDDIFFIRFMLPALMALCVLLAVFVTGLARLLAMRSRKLVVLAVIPVLAILVYTMPFARYALGLREEQTRVVLMGRYLREVLPPNAVVLTGLQGGAVSHYTGAQIVRLDLLEPGTLDTWVDRLTRRGYRPVLVVDEVMEVPALRAHAAGSAALKYRWVPRAEFHSTSAILFFIAETREAPAAEAAPVDVIR